MPAITRPKQLIRDYCRDKKYTPPVYYLVKEERIDLHKHYTVQLAVNNVIVSEGTGLSRRLAEFKAALNAVHYISQNDPTIFDNIKMDKYGRNIGRSVSVDYLSNAASRSDSFASVHVLGHHNYPSAASNIDSVTIKSDYDDSPVASSKINQTNDEISQNGNHHHHNDVEISSDEGVSVKSSESSTSVPTTTSSSSPQTRLKTTIDHIDHSKSKSRSNFLSSINPFRAISRRTFGRKSSSSSSEHKNGGKITEPDENSVSRPTSSTSASSSSSAFSSNSSISSSTPICNLEEPSKLSDDALMSNYAAGTVNGGTGTNLAESIIEEVEEEEEMVEEVNDGEKTPRQNGNKHDSYISDTISHQSNENTNNSNKLIYVNSFPLLRSVSSSYSLSSNATVSGTTACTHSHFSIYGPLLCNSTSNCSRTSLNIESSPSATLLRYCVRMYLPMPYYDIQYDKKCLATCRVVLSVEESKRHKLPIILSDSLIGCEFNGKGYGETFKLARHQAASVVIEKLKEARIYFE